MTDTFSREERSIVMGKIRSTGNAATELRFVEILNKHNIEGWQRNTDLPGRPDFVFPDNKLVVFIDGDFWHGNPRKFRLPKSNVPYWRDKILGNRWRDKRIGRTLRAKGWKVYRFWQSSLNNEDAVMSKLRRGLRATPSPSPLPSR